MNHLNYYPGNTEAIVISTYTCMYNIFGILVDKMCQNVSINFYLNVSMRS